LTRPPCWSWRQRRPPPGWGFPGDQWVFPYAGTDAHDTYAIVERADLHRSPAIRVAGRRVLELAGMGIDEVDLVDLYSCFPSAVQIAANELGLPIADDARPLTVTGGLTFAGGPWNNYTMHSIATMAELLTRRPGLRGLITANGGDLTKHSLGVRNAAATVRIPVGGRAIGGGPRTDPARGRGLGRGRGSGVLDRALHPRRRPREGIAGGANPRRCARWPPLQIRRWQRLSWTTTSPAPRCGYMPTGQQRCSR
jgi:hypothetical protein